MCWTLTDMYDAPLSDNTVTPTTIVFMTLTVAVFLMMEKIYSVPALLIQSWFLLGEDVIDIYYMSVKST
jgi:hypothetical protein